MSMAQNKVRTTIRIKEDIFFNFKGEVAKKKSNMSKEVEKFMEGF